MLGRTLAVGTLVVGLPAPLGIVVRAQVPAPGAPVSPGTPLGNFASLNPHRPLLMTCDDLVENKAPPFDVALSAEDKLALREFLKLMQPGAFTIMTRPVRYRSASELKPIWVVIGVVFMLIIGWALSRLLNKSSAQPPAGGAPAKPDAAALEQNKQGPP